MVGKVCTWIPDVSWCFLIRNCWCNSLHLSGTSIPENSEVLIYQFGMMKTAIWVLLITSLRELGYVEGAVLLPDPWELCFNYSKCKWMMKKLKKGHPHWPDHVFLFLGKVWPLKTCQRNCAKRVNSMTWSEDVFGVNHVIIYSIVTVTSRGWMYWCT